MSARRLLLCSLVFAAPAPALAVAAPAWGSAAVKCPIATAAVIRWAFSSSVSGFTHGRGTLNGSRAMGTICAQSASGSHPGAALVLSVAGRRAALVRGIAVGGVLGARLVMPVSVTATADPACRVGTHGTVTLFSSYNGARKDSARLAFAAACRVADAFARGAKVHVALPR